MQHCLAQTPIKRGDGPLALVLAPTRELAQQIEKEVNNLLLAAEFVYVVLNIYELVLEIVGTVCSNILPLCGSLI